MKKFISLTTFLFLIGLTISAQQQWVNVDASFGPLPNSVHVYFTDKPIDTGIFRAYYLIADLKDRSLEFTTDTTFKRRLTPDSFYIKDQQPLVVVNGTFFSFETNRNLNLVIKEGRLVSYNVHSLALRGKDTFTYRHPVGSAFGISKSRKADVAWVFSDSSKKRPYAFQTPVPLIRDSNATVGYERYVKRKYSMYQHSFNIPPARKWKMETAIAGGPVLVQNGTVKISNNEEWKFPGKELKDKHPRTAMGYTADGKLIILVVEGRNERAHGATLTQEAQLLADLGCVEALNLDGGGSSCLLINGKETIRPSDKKQRPVPGVFVIRKK